MLFLPEKYNHAYGETVKNTYSTIEKLYCRYQSNAQYSELTARLLDDLKSLCQRIEANLLSYEVQMRTFGAWAISFTPGTKAFNNRLSLADDFAVYEALKRDIEIVNKALSKLKANEELETEPQMANGSRSPTVNRQAKASLDELWSRLRSKQNAATLSLTKGANRKTRGQPALTRAQL